MYKAGSHYQSNETCGSQQTELEGCKRSFGLLSQMGLPVAVFVSDRHQSIEKWIRECRKDTTRYYDLWHVAKSITKKLLKLARKKAVK